MNYQRVQYQFDHQTNTEDNLKHRPWATLIPTATTSGLPRHRSEVGGGHVLEVRAAGRDGGRVCGEHQDVPLPRFAEPADTSWLSWRICSECSFDSV